MIDIICFSQNNWEARKARKHQFMLHLSHLDKVGYVLYVEPPVNFIRLLFSRILENEENNKRRERALSFKCEKIEDKLWLYTPIFFIPFAFRFQLIYNVNLYINLLILRIKIRQFGLDQIILWLYHPFDFKLLSWFKERILSVFDWAEDWSEYFAEYDSRKKTEIRRLEEKIVEEVDLVFTVSDELLKRAKRKNFNSCRMLDGTVPDIFINYNGELPKELENQPHPILTYAGTISHRLDLDLLCRLADELPQATLLLVGQNNLKNWEIESLSKRKNVIFTGGKEYSELPAYLKNSDVMLLPYLAEKSKSIFPTKIFDYLATGKPIVSTKLNELEQFKGSIQVADSPEQFIKLVKESRLENQKDSIECAIANSWEKRAEMIMNILNGYIKKKKVLVIPHHPSYGAMKIRLIEIARLLSSNYDLYLLDWLVDQGEGALLDRIIFSIHNLIRIPWVSKSGNLKVVRIPTLSRPYKIARQFNSFQLQKFLEVNNFDVVVNGSFSTFGINIKKGFKYIFDVCDYPFCGDESYDQLVEENLKNQLKLADAVTVVSSGLVKYVKEKYSREAVWIPNGAYMGKIRKPDSEKIAQIRKKYNLEGKWIIGYIGFIGEWVDVDLLIQAFKEIKKEIKNAVLLLIGGWQGKISKESLGGGIIVTGLVPDEISNYFALLDVGVLPHKKNIFQDLAFHIKLIEYTAARKMVVSTPIDEVKNLKFPNVIMADLNVLDWTRAIMRAKAKKWDPGWDNLVEPYDWECIRNKYISIIEGLS